MTVKEKILFIEHMKIKGYVFKEEKYPQDDESNSGFIVGEHEEHGFTNVLTDWEGATGFVTGIATNSKVGTNYFEYLMFVNDLNLKSSLTKFSGLIRHTKYPAQLRITAIYYGPYEKKAFDKFLDDWHLDKGPFVDSHPKFEKFFFPDVAKA